MDTNPFSLLKHILTIIDYGGLKTCISTIYFRTCSGLILTSYNKLDPDQSFRQKLSLAIDAYNKHKQSFSIKENIALGWYDDRYLDYELKLKLEFLRIYFDATSFDKITKDRSNSAMDKLSAIGGTMGLLTGFSIISGVEIVYFIIKIFLSFMPKKKHLIP